jgi:serine/threonine protein kinase
MTSPLPFSSIIGNYTIGKLLGIGAFGEVRLCIDVHSGKKFAIKMISKCQINDISEAERVSREFFILTSLQHKNVIELHDVLQDKHRLFLVMELASGGSLDGLLKLIEASGERMEEERARHIFTQIVTAVRYCHRKHVLHRDLKPENVLLAHSDGNEFVKVADFGLSATVSYGFRPVTPACTPCYAAPELLFPQFFPGLITTANVNKPKVRFAKTHLPDYCNPFEIRESEEGRGGGEEAEEFIKPSTPPQDPGLVDIWSLGVILFRMTQGKLPFAIDSLRALRSSHLAWSSALSTYEHSTINKINNSPFTSHGATNPVTLFPFHFLPPQTTSTSKNDESSLLPLPSWNCLLEPSDDAVVSNTMSPYLRNLLIGMLQTDPFRRFSGDRVAIHTWCAGHSVTSDAHLSRIHSQAVVLEKNAVHEPTSALNVSKESEQYPDESINKEIVESILKSANFINTVVLDPIQSRRPSFSLPSIIFPTRRLSISELRTPDVQTLPTVNLERCLTPSTSFASSFHSNETVNAASIILDPLVNICKVEVEALVAGDNAKEDHSVPVTHRRRYSLPCGSPSSPPRTTIQLQRRNSMTRLSPLMPNDGLRR